MAVFPSVSCRLPRKKIQQPNNLQQVPTENMEGTMKNMFSSKHLRCLAQSPSNRNSGSWESGARTNKAGPSYFCGLRERLLSIDLCGDKVTIINVAYARRMFTECQDGYCMWQIVIKQYNILRCMHAGRTNLAKWWVFKWVFTVFGTLKNTEHHPLVKEC